MKDKFDIDPEKIAERMLEEADLTKNREVHVMDEALPPGSVIVLGSVRITSTKEFREYLEKLKKEMVG